MNRLSWFQFVLVIIFVLMVTIVGLSNFELPSRAPGPELPAVRSGWLIYVDEVLGFTTEYPDTWYDLGQSGTFRGRCFASTPQGLRTEPRFCVDFDPDVPVLAVTDTSDYVKPEKALDELMGAEAGETSTVGTRRFKVVERYPINSLPAIEIIETHTPEAEGIERAYTVAVYLDSPQNGPIRLSMHAINQDQFEEIEPLLRQMLMSFSLLK